MENEYNPTQDVVDFIQETYGHIVPIELLIDLIESSPLVGEEE